MGARKNYRKMPAAKKVNMDFRGKKRTPGTIARGIS